jgi:hypothetical protein
MKDRDIDFVVENFDTLERIKKEAIASVEKNLLQSFAINIDGFKIGCVNVFECISIDYTHRLAFILVINGKEKNFEVRLNQHDFLINVKSNIVDSIRKQLLSQIWEDIVKDISIK